MWFGDWDPGEAQQVTSGVDDDDSDAASESDSEDESSGESSE